MQSPSSSICSGRRFEFLFWKYRASNSSSSSLPDRPKVNDQYASVQSGETEGSGSEGGRQTFHEPNDRCAHILHPHFSVVNQNHVRFFPALVLHRSTLFSHATTTKFDSLLLLSLRGSQPGRRRGRTESAKKSRVSALRRSADTKLSMKSVERKLDRLIINRAGAVARPRTQRRGRASFC